MDFIDAFGCRSDQVLLGSVRKSLETTGQRHELVQESDIVRASKSPAAEVAHAGCLLLGWSSAVVSPDPEHQLDRLLPVD